MKISESFSVNPKKLKSKNGSPAGIKSTMKVKPKKMISGKMMKAAAVAIGKSISSEPPLSKTSEQIGKMNRKKASKSPDAKLKSNVQILSTPTKTNIAKVKSGKQPTMNKKVVKGSKKQITKKEKKNPVQIIENNDANSATSFGITDDMIEAALNALGGLRKERKKKKLSLLEDKDFMILQVSLVKIPEVEHERRKCIKLPHGVFGKDADVCLFVSDVIPKDFVIQTPDERIEHSIDHYQEVLKAHEIQGVSTIMPRLQLKTEYDTYELQRKLVSNFDLFLCQSYLLTNRTYSKSVGIAFIRKNKFPLPVNFPKKNAPTPDPKFQKSVANALRTTWFYYKNHSDLYSIRVGTIAHPLESLKENIAHVISELEKPDVIPGGVSNVRTIMLKTTLSKAAPLYFNIAPRNSVPVPTVKSDLPKRLAVEGELSTLPGKKVTVLPTGEVFVQDDGEEAIIFSSDEEETKPTPRAINGDKSSVKKQKKRKKAKQEESDSSDDEADAAEAKYMQNWSTELAEAGGSSADEDNNVLKKKEKLKTKKKNVQKKGKQLQPKKKSKKA